MAHRFANPKPGTVPAITYTYVTADEDGAAMAEPHHRLDCKCKWFLLTPEAKAAKRGAQAHVTDHLAAMIHDPEADDE